MAARRLIFGGTPTRVDRYLRDELSPRLGRRQVAALLSAGAVRVNGRVAVKGMALRPGDEVVVDDGAAPPTLRPIAAPLTVVHCDAELVAIDKAPGVPSTAGASASPSVAAALLDRFPEMAAIDPVRAAGLVHRLDTGTSGLLLAARTADAYRRLRQAFTAKRLVKEYLAVVEGRLGDAGSVTRPLARAARGRGRMVVVDDVAAGWRAETEYRPLAHADDLTLVHLRMRTGVTHQLRAHLAYLGHSVLGDARYGAAPARATAPAWHFLHALRLRDDRDEVPELATSFPAHWTPLFARVTWSTALPGRW